VDEHHPAPPTLATTVVLPPDAADLQQRITQLTADLAHAQERARVAEEQLHRVYVAVREYKARHLKARQAEQQAAAQQAKQSSGLYDSWATKDPGLDERLSEFLDGEFEHDRSRGWMLGE